MKNENYGSQHDSEKAKLAHLAAFQAYWQQLQQATPRRPIITPIIAQPRREATEPLVSASVAAYLAEWFDK
jgi:hypothetical protein